MSREITPGQREWLVGELAAWRAANVLDEAQAGAVLALYPTPEQLGDRTQARALGVLGTLAAILVGLAVLLLIGANWAAIPTPVRIGLILAGLIGVHGVGLHLRFRQGRPTAADIAAFLGCLLYGGGIWLIAQTFHLSAHDGAAWWWWALGVLPFAMISEGLALQALYATLLAIWIGVEVFGFGNLGLWLFGRWPRMPNLAPSLLAMLAPAIAWAYRRRQPAALGLDLAVLAWWAVLLPVTWGRMQFVVESVGAVGAVLLLASGLHRAGNPMAIPSRLLGAGLVGGALVPLSFSGWHREFLNRPWAQGGGPGDAVLAPLAVLVTGLGALAVILAITRSRAGGPSAGREPLGAAIRRNALPLAIIALMAALAWYTPALGASLGPWPPTLAANGAMVALAFWLIRLGLAEDRGRPFTAGVLYFLLWCLLRYVDLFGNFGGMLGAALLFFVGGAALFGVAQYWRGRRAAPRPPAAPIAEVPHAVEP